MVPPYKGQNLNLANNNGATTKYNNNNTTAVDPSLAIAHAGQSLTTLTFGHHIIIIIIDF